jgi:hypothetical protein
VEGKKLLLSLKYQFVSLADIALLGNTKKKQTQHFYLDFSVNTTGAFI